MRHEVRLEGAGFRLRPVREADAALIVALRNDPSLNRYLHAGATEVSQQLQWLARYFERPGDHYFVIEHRGSGEAEGLVAIYDLDPATRSAEWGRWILRPRSRAAVESAWLVYRCAFESLGLETLFCRTVADNLPVVSFHDSCGVLQRQVLPGHFDLDGKRHDAVEHRVSRTDWPAIAPRLQMLATRSARRTAHA